MCIKELSSHLIYGPWCMYTVYQSTLATYINICPQTASYIFKPSSSFPSHFPTNISYPFHISFKPPFTTEFPRHILSNVFDQSFHISAVFQNRHFDLFCLPCCIVIIYVCIELQTLTQQQFRNVLTVVT